MKCEDLIDLDTYCDEMGGMIEYSEFKWRTQTYWHIACLWWFISVNEAVIFEIQPLLDAQQRRRVREPPAAPSKSSRTNIAARPQLDPVSDLFLILNQSILKH
jgi:hypothetical protein